MMDCAELMETKVLRKDVKWKKKMKPKREEKTKKDAKKAFVARV